MTSSDIEQKEKIKTLLDKAYKGRTDSLSHSIELAEEALELSKTIKDNSLIGKSCNQLSLFHMINSDFEVSNDYSKKAIICFETIGDQTGIADAKYNMGSVLYKSDDYHGGLMYLLDALKIYKKNKDLPNKAKVEKAVGTIYEYIGDEENAYKTYQSAIKSAKDIGNTNLESNVLNNLSGLVLKRDETENAMRMIMRSLELKKETKDIRGYGFALYGRGKVYLKTKQYDKAENDFFEALKIHEERVEHLGVSMILRKLGELYYNLEEYSKAEAMLMKCLKHVGDHSVFMAKTKNYHLLYLIHKAAKNSSESLKFLELYLHEKEAIMKFQTLKVIENYELINKMNILESDALMQKEKQNIIEQKREDEKKVLKQKQEFLSIMSHEIRTPLNAITTIVSLLNDKITGEYKDLYESLQFASDNLITIVNDVLDFTKLDSNKASIEVNNMNFNSLISNIYNLHLSQARIKGLNLVVKNSIAETTNYLLDQTKVSQILSNLVNNAIKFTDKGSIEFSAVLIDKNETHDTIRFSIKDTGEGISKEDLAQVFDSFSQIKPITTRKQGGTGLGLAIVKRLVELHQSKIQVISELQKGSEFYFDLILERVKKKAPKEPVDFSSLKGKIALLAEDTMMNAMLMKRVLSNWGIIVDHVLNGKEAIAYSSNKKYDFILMDVHMPGMNGMEATQIIKSNKDINSNTPIFAVTADVLTNIENKNADLFDDFLWKPLEIEKLLEALMKTEQSVLS